MLGRQSDILVTNEDLASLEAKLRARADVEFLSSYTNEGRNALLPLKSLPMAPGDIGKVSRRCFLAPNAWAPYVDIEPLSDVKVHISPERSEIIDFGRSYCANGLIQAGRIYYTPCYWMEPELVDKTPEFVAWAERVVRAIRKSLILDKELGAYVGRDAAGKIASGELKVIPMLYGP